MINKIKKIIFKKFFERKILLLGKSHFLNYRPKYKSLKNISDLDYKIFSQNGEDGIIDYLLYSLDITSPKFIEIGIGDYEESNTRYLFETTNSKGLIIDCIKNLKTEVLKNTKLWRGDLKIIENFIDSENIINSSKGNDKNFSYSKALKQFGGKWTYEELGKFLYKPKDYIGGTKMNFAGLKNVEDRANLIFWLRQHSDNPVPLPE